MTSGGMAWTDRRTDITTRLHIVSFVFKGADAQKWNWIGQMLRSSDDGIAGHAPKWMPQGHRGKG